MATAASAQEAPTPGRVEAAPVSAGDIVVTARRLGETVLETPASVSVLEPAAIESKNITNVGQLNAVVPGLVVTSGVVGSTSFTLRGLGSNASSFGLEPSVAEYQDGVYLAHFRDTVAPLYDVAQVEIIRGTQSTLLGKNTSVGAVSIVTRRPSRDFGAQIKVVHSFGIGGNRADGFVNVPVTPDLAVRGAFLASDQDGFMRNSVTGQREQRLRELSGRISARWKPSDSIEVYLSYQHDDRRGQGQEFQIISDPALVVTNRAASFGQLNLNVLPDRVTDTASLPLGGTLSGVPPYDRQPTNRLNAILTFGLGDYTLTSQTSYLKWKANRNFDQDFTAANIYNIIDTERNRSFSQEVRLNSPDSGMFKWLLGGYYYRNRWGLDRTFQGAPVTAVAFVPLTGFATSTFVGPTRAFSGFGSVSVELTDAFSLNAGARYTHERKTGRIERVSAGSLANTNRPIPFTVFAPKTTNNLDYSVGAEFKATDRVLLYASYARGSKSGGFQEFPTTALAAPYDQEVAYSAELGAKARFPFGTFTAALYDTRVKGFQQSYTQAVGTPPITLNFIGNANIRSRGFEAAADLTPVPDLRVGGSVLYTDGEFTDRFPEVGAAVALAGTPLTRAPRWSGRLYADYDADLGNELKLSLGSSVALTESYDISIRVLSPDAPRSAGRAEVDGHIDLEDTGRGITASIIGTNLTNERYVNFTSIVSGGGTGIGNRAFYGSINRPRVIALQLKFEM